MSVSRITELLSSRARRALGVLPLCIGLSAATSGCFIIDDNGNAPPYPGEPDQIHVDTGAAFTNITPGDGAGVFVEYFGDGAWSVTTTCDTDKTDRPCEYDIVISAAEDVSISDPQLLPSSEPVDKLTLRDDGSIQLTTGTASRLGGIIFYTDPGAAIELDMLLDGQAQPWFIYWITDGEPIHGDETSSNPIDFIPTLP